LEGDIVASITQQGVIMILTNRFGASCTDLLSVIDNTFGRQFKGISVHATLPNKWVISIQAGDGLYSDPRAKTHSYTSVEIACWPEGEGIANVEALVEKGYMPDCDNVCGWVPVEELQKVISIVANLPRKESTDV
jgi:hypothetical protein